jgi:hypothetical protein
LSKVSDEKQKIIKEDKTVEWTPEEKKEIPPRYGCEILLENTTVEKVKDPSFPSDACIVYYKIDNNFYIDLCRGSRFNIFDMYYDKFGSGAVQKIDWAYGRVNPKIWGYRAPEKKKRR